MKTSAAIKETRWNPITVQFAPHEGLIIGRALRQLEQRANEISLLRGRPTNFDYTGMVDTILTAIVAELKDKDPSYLSEDLLRHNFSKLPTRENLDSRYPEIIAQIAEKSAKK